MIYYSKTDIDRLWEKINCLVWEHREGFLNDETEDYLLQIQGDLENMIGVEIDEKYIYKKAD